MCSFDFSNSRGRANGNRFLLVSLNMDAILAEATIYQRRLALDKMTKGLGLQDAYDNTLERIRRQGGSKSRFGVEVLMWISHSERPFRSQELCHALGVELGAEDFSTQNVLSIRTLLGYTLGLVTIDERASWPRLLHFTLQDYLGQHPTLFVTAQSMMAEICLTYLNSHSVRALPPNPGVVRPHPVGPPRWQALDDMLEAAPFLEYTTCFWGAHAARGVTEPVKSLALRLLGGYENHISATILSRKKLRERDWMWDGQGTSGLHCIAFWGIAEIAIAMFEMKRWQVNGCDSEGRTPLMWAVERSDCRMVELFLKQEDIEPGTVTKDGRTALAIAARSGDEGVVKLLLEREDVDPNSPDSNGRTPLSFAAERGWGGLVKLLLGRGDIDPNSSDNDGLTPLLYAFGRFWEHDNSYGLTYPSAGHEIVINLLLQRGDVDPNLPDINGRTPLSFAAERGREGLVKLLLDRGDIEPNSSDNDGRTPLLYAISRLLEYYNPYSLSSPTWGHENVIKVLLERRDVDHNLPDRNGRTPLSFAAERGREGLVKLPLDRGDVDLSSSDKDGRTPLLYAFGGLREYYNSCGLSYPTTGHENVIKVLLERRDVDHNLPDSNGRTPLSFAAERGREGLVKLLLSRGDTDLNSSDNSGRTPLLYALGRLWEYDNPCDQPYSSAGHENVIKILLERGDVDHNSRDSNGRTTLSFAAEKGRESLVKLLLSRGDVDPNSSDIYGRTPLLYALWRLWDHNNPCGLSSPTTGQENVIMMLLERGDVDHNSRDGDGRTPLSFAAERGWEGLVKLLLDRGDVDPNSSDIYGRTPYHLLSGHFGSATIPMAYPILPRDKNM